MNVLNLHGPSQRRTGTSNGLDSLRSSDTPGEGSTSRYSVWLVDFMCRRALLENDPGGLAIQ